MRHYIMVCGVLVAGWPGPSVFGQLSVYPHVESFDASAAPPAGWSVEGFEISSSVSHSPPNCLLARGNMVSHTVTTEEVDPSEMSFKRLQWYERRSGSAAQFSLWLSYIADTARTVLAQFNSIASSNSYQLRTVELAGHIDGRSPGRFEFTIANDSMNSTGVLRIDDVELIIEPRFDLSVSVSPPPQLPLFAGEEQPVRFILRNLATATAEGVVIDVSIFTAAQYAPTNHRLVPTRSIPAGDSSELQIAFRPQEAGLHTIVGAIRWDDDQNASNDTSSVRIPVGYAPGAIRITEFMFDPEREDEPEWVEIFAPGPTIVDGANLFLSDKGSQKVRAFSAGALIVPGEYAVIAAAASIGDIYSLKGIQWSAVRFSSLNNTSADAVVLRDMYGTTLDSVYYEPSWGVPGKSLERRDWTLCSTDRSTWQVSRDSSGGTPGSPNSVQRIDVDGAIAEFSVLWNSEQGRVFLTVAVENRGRKTLNGGSIVFNELAENTPKPSLLTFADSLTIPIASDERIMLHPSWTPAHPGSIRLQARLSIPGDQKALNDTSRTALYVPYPAGSVLVNEVMFDPVPGECEWIELLNTSAYDFSLEGCTLLDLPTASGYRTRIRIDVPFLIPPGGLGVVAADSSLFSLYPWLRDDPYRGRVLLLHRSGGLGLNAERDGIVLYDPIGFRMDSILYDADWHNPAVDPDGRSLERVRIDLPGTLSRTWTSAPGPFGASPGRTNLARPAKRQTTAAFSISPNPFSPDGDGHDDISFIRYQYPSPTVFVRARIFDDEGRAVRILANGSLYPGNDMLLWDGLDDNGQRVRMGPYILFLEAWNRETAFSRQEKKVVVVAR